MVNLIPKIVYEDESLLVINKPAGLVVNRSQTATQTLQDWVEVKIHDQSGLERSGVVHRLDKETSGLMVIAKTQAAFENLTRQFKNRKVKKKYIAQVYGKLEPKQGVIAVPIGRSRQNREKFTVAITGRPAETEYRVKRYYPRYTEVELVPKTGRTHQIRVHLAYMGHPVVGDARYAGEKQRKVDRQRQERHQLEAVELGLYHPVSGKWMEFSI